MSDAASVSFWMVAQLAWRDVVHERLLSACLIVALAGLLAPLLVLFGLKSGVMQSLLAELVEDPVFREIRPASTENYPDTLLDTLRARPEAAFVVGSVSRGASIVRIENATAESVFIDMVPTASGDPLLVDNGVTALEGTLVLSAPIAERLAVATGDTVTLSTERNDAQGESKARVSLVVGGILPLHVDTIERAYVPAELAVDIESFREGFAVADRGWAGAVRDVEPAYHGVVLALSKTLDEMVFARLTNNTDFYIVDIIDESEFAQRFKGRAPQEAVQMLDIRVIDAPAGEASVTRVRRNVAGSLVDIWPYADTINLDVQLPDQSWQSLPLQISLDNSLADTEIALPASLDERFDATTTVVLRLSGDGAKPAEDTLVFEAQRMASHAGEGLLVSSRLAGLMQRGMERPIAYDSERSAFILKPLGSRSFRLFANTLGEVEPLVGYLEDMGIEVISAVREIRRLQRLDQGLSSLFTLIAIATSVTGAIVLLASQYGAVERKRTTLARLRLIGFARKDVALTPILQGLVIALVGIALAALLTLATCTSMNIWLADKLGFNGAVCRLEPAPLGIGAALALALSVASSLGAALTATRIDPAEGMRDE